MDGADVQLFLQNNAAPLGTNVSIYDRTGSLVLGPQPLTAYGDTYLDIGAPGNISRVSLEQVFRVTVTAGPVIQIVLW